MYGLLNMYKLAARLTQEKRERLSAKQFAIPESKARKIGVEDEIKGEAKGKYPIHDLKHARNALARVSQYGTPEEREAVRRKVYAKYPQLREHFEEAHGGESPTSKENIKKPEQGDVGKESCFKDKVARVLKIAGIQNPFYTALRRELKASADNYYKRQIANKLKSLQLAAPRPKVPPRVPDVGRVTPPPLPSTVR